MKHITCKNLCVFLVSAFALSACGDATDPDQTAATSQAITEAQPVAAIPDAVSDEDEKANVIEANGITTASSSYQGCPYGYVCLYPNASWNGGRPSHKWFNYGCYNLSNQYGYHRLFNNQYGGAKAWYCYGYNCTSCTTYQPAGTYFDKYMTPINSIRLTP
jgi:hypothetical protein